MATAMVDRTSSSRRFWLPLTLVVALAAACSPSAAAPTDAPTATLEAPPSVAPTPSDDGITAGEPHPSPTATPVPTSRPDSDARAVAEPLHRRSPSRSR